MVLGPDRLNRFPPVQEFDFYNAAYIDEEKKSIPIEIEVILTQVSEEIQLRCRNHLEYWHKLCNAERYQRTQSRTDTLDYYAMNVMEQFEKIRGWVRNGEAKDFNKQTKTEQISIGTRYILAEVHRQLLMDVDVHFTKNDAIDLLHTVVPAAYCDYVLLDKRWCTILNRAAKKLRKTKPIFPIAIAFSGKEGSVQEFLLELEAKVN